MVVIMGRKTFESVNKPLPGRLNIVMTSNASWKANDTLVAPNLQAAIQLATGENFKELFIIGGGEIYKQAMPLADRIYMTRVHAVLEGDTFFPAIPNESWELASTETFKADEKHAYDFSFEIWNRKQPAA